MAHHRLRIIMILIVVSLVSQTGLALSVDQPSFSLADEMFYLVDADGQLQLNDLLDDPEQHPFLASRDHKPGNDDVNKPTWLKIPLDFSGVADEPENTTDYILTMVSGSFSEIRIYRPDANGNYSEYITGDQYPAKQREIDSPRYAFNVASSPQQQTVYIRYIGATNTLSLPWFFLEQSLFTEGGNFFWTLNLLSIGMLIGVFIFNAGIGITLRSKNYLYYSSYILFSIVSLINLDGIAFLWLWPSTPQFNALATDTLTLTVALTRLLTIASFVHLKQLSSRLYRLTNIWLVVLCVSLLFTATIGLKEISPWLGGIIWGVSMVLGFVIMLVAIKKKMPLAIPIFIVLMIPIVGTMLQGMIQAGVLETGTLQMQTAKIAFVLHALLFSVCLALQMKLEVDSRIIAQHDGLTGMPSMMMATERFKVARALARRYNWQVAVLFIDLDHFKPVNDTHGHDVGDQVLIEVAERINNCVREVDTAARIGGDEFLIIQTEVKDLSATGKVAEKILSALQEPIIIKQQPVHIGASIGIARYPQDNDELVDLVKIADTEMYKVKKTGKNSFSIFGAASNDQPAIPAPEAASV